MFVLVILYLKNYKEFERDVGIGYKLQLILRLVNSLSRKIRNEVSKNRGTCLNMNLS